MVFRHYTWNNEFTQKTTKDRWKGWKHLSPKQKDSCLWNYHKNWNHTYKNKHHTLEQKVIRNRPKLRQFKRLINYAIYVFSNITPTKLSNILNGGLLNITIRWKKYCFGILFFLWYLHVMKMAWVYWNKQSIQTSSTVPFISNTCMSNVSSNRNFLFLRNLF